MPKLEVQLLTEKQTILVDCEQVGRFAVRQGLPSYGEGQGFIVFDPTTQVHFQPRRRGGGFALCASQAKALELATLLEARLPADYLAEASLAIYKDIRQVIWGN